VLSLRQGVLTTMDLEGGPAILRRRSTAASCDVTPSQTCWVHKTPASAWKGRGGCFCFSTVVSRRRLIGPRMLHRNKHHAGNTQPSGWRQASLKRYSFRECTDQLTHEEEQLRTSLQMGMWEPRGLYRHLVTDLATASYCHTGILQVADPLPQRCAQKD
jgi:hypothetical protein